MFIIIFLVASVYAAVNAYYYNQENSYMKANSLTNLGNVSQAGIYGMYMANLCLAIIFGLLAFGMFVYILSRASQSADPMAPASA